MGKYTNFVLDSLFTLLVWFGLFYFLKWAYIATGTIPHDAYFMAYGGAMVGFWSFICHDIKELLKDGE